MAEQKMMQDKRVVVTGAGGRIGRDMALALDVTAQTHYQAELDAGRFCIQHCPQCQQHVFAPRELCPRCGASPLRWVRASGLGTVYSASTLYRKADAGGNYNVALIDLDEGVRLMSRVEGVAPELVRIGDRLQARVVQQDGRGLVLFQPVREPQKGAA